MGDGAMENPKSEIRNVPMRWKFLIPNSEFRILRFCFHRRHQVEIRPDASDEQRGCGGDGADGVEVGDRDPQDRDNSNDLDDCGPGDAFGGVADDENGSLEGEQGGKAGNEGEDPGRREGECGQFW